jgi:hypothetical protein
MNAKHQFKYTYNDTELEEFSPVDITFDMPGDVTITQMLWNFECYLKACGFYFDGHLEVVPEESYDVIDDTNYCCMGDSDCCGLEETSSSLDNEWTKADKNLKEWNEKLAKLEADVKKNKWVHGMCNPPSPDWKKNDSDNCWNS